MFFTKKFSIRLLQENDLSKIRDWIISDAKKGHLLQLYQEKNNMITLINAMRDNIFGQPFRSNINNKYEERLGNVLIYLNKKNVIGYALLYEKYPGSANTDIEIKLFHIDELYQNKGNGTMFISLIEKYIGANKRLHIECLPNSTSMMHLLEKKNYEIVHISENGKRSYIKNFG